MKISESEVILIVVLVLIGFVLYTQTGGAMKTTRVKKVSGKHVSSQCGGTYGCPCKSDLDCLNDDSDDPSERLYCMQNKCKWGER